MTIIENILWLLAFLLGIPVVFVIAFVIACLAEASEYNDEHDLP